MRPLSFVGWHSPPVASPVGRSCAGNFQDSACNYHVEAVILSLHVAPGSSDANAVCADVAGRDRFDPEHVAGTFLTSKTVSMRRESVLGVVSSQIGVGTKRA